MCDGTVLVRTVAQWRGGKKHSKKIVFEHYKSMDFGKYMYCKGPSDSQEFWTQTWKLFQRGQDFQHHEMSGNCAATMEAFNRSMCEPSSAERISTKPSRK